MLLPPALLLMMTMSSIVDVAEDRRTNGGNLSSVPQQTAPQMIAQAGTLYFLLCAKDSEDHLASVFTNIKALAQSFVGGYQVIVFYDVSTDDTLATLHRQSHVTVIENNQTPLPKRTQRLAHARNALIDALPNDCQYFVVMDSDDVCAGPFDQDVWDDAWGRTDEWDSITFNRRYYYDVWPLYYGLYSYNCWAYGDNSRAVAISIKDDLTQRLSAQGSALFAANSSFGGIAIYRKAAYENCRYHNRRVKLKNQLPHQVFATEENCEHVPFHLDGAKFHGARHRIHPSRLFTGIIDEEAKWYGLAVEELRNVHRGQPKQQTRITEKG